MDTTKFLKELILQFDIPSEFGCYGGGDGFSLPGSIRTALENCGEKWECHNGSSKVAIVFPELEVVLKIPFNGMFDDGEYESEYCDDCDCDCCCSICCPHSEDRTNEFVTFEGADGDWNYCELEARYYQEAKDAGFDIFFAYTEYFGETGNGYPVYLQELCEPNDWTDLDEKMYKTCSAQSKTHAQELREKPYYRNYFGEKWVAIAIEKYGEEFVDKFLLDFTNDYSYLFGDMHGENFGYRVNGTPVILDFSDFNG